MHGDQCIYILFEVYERGSNDEQDTGYTKALHNIQKIIPQLISQKLKCYLRTFYIVEKPEMTFIQQEQRDSTGNMTNQDIATVGQSPGPNQSS